MLLLKSKHFSSFRGVIRPRIPPFFNNRFLSPVPGGGGLVRPAERYQREQLPIIAAIKANRIRMMGLKTMMSPHPLLRVMTESSVVMTLLGPSGAALGLSRRGLPQPGQDWASLDTSFWQSGHLIRLVAGLGAVGGGGALASISESRLLTFAQAAMPLVQ